MDEKDSKESRDYVLRECDLKLIKAAIELGDTLLRLPEITEKSREDIARFQEVLRRLPEATLGVSAEYGFAIVNYEPDFRGVNRDWFVSIMRDGLIEISSIYKVLPDRD